MMTRNYPDWVWSAYNYWCNPHFDKDCEEDTGWVNPEIHIRSALGFEKIIQSSINETEIASPLHFSRPCEKAATMFQSYLGRLWTHVTRENTIVLAAEELEEHPEVVWRKLAHALGLNYSHPKMYEFVNYRYNTQFEKGADTKVNISVFTPGIYAASKFEPMTNSSREVLSKCWYSDCLWASRASGYNYTICSGSSRNRVVSDNKKTSSIDDANINRQSLFRINKSSTAFEATPFPTHGKGGGGGTSKSGSHHSGFLLRQLKACHAAFGPMQGSHGGRSHGHTPRVGANEPISTSLTPAPAPSFHRSLIISSRLVHRVYLQNLFDYALGRSHVVVQYDDPNLCALCSNIDVSLSQIVVAAYPRAIDFVKGVGRKNNGHAVFLKPSAQKCTPFESSGSNLSSLMSDSLLNPEDGFDRVVVISNDVLVNLWTAYQKRMGLPHGLQGEALRLFNWSMWEIDASHVLQGDLGGKGDASENKNKNFFHNDNELWTIDETRFVQSLPAENVMVVHAEDVVFGNNKRVVLGKILHFLQLELLQTSQTEGMSQTIAHYKDKLLIEEHHRILRPSLLDGRIKCAYIMTYLHSTADNPYYYGRINMDYAYASSRLVCEAARYVVSNGGLSLTTKTDTTSLAAACLIKDKNNEYLNAVSFSLKSSNTTSIAHAEYFSSLFYLTSFPSWRKMCRLRYGSKVFVPGIVNIDFKTPVALMARPGNDAVDTRLLIEHATSFYSGSLQTNEKLLPILYAEGNCGMRMSIIHVNPRGDIILKKTRKGQGTISPQNNEKRKCNKGMLRGFSRVIILVRDPFKSIWDAYKAFTNSSLSQLLERLNNINSSAVLKQEWESTILQLTSEYKKEHLLDNDGLIRVSKEFAVTEALVVSYESLFFDPTRLQVLHKMLEFANHKKLSEERFLCAGIFVDGDHLNRELQLMTKFFFLNSFSSASSSLFCRIWRMLIDKLHQGGPGIKYPFYRLYSHDITRFSCLP